MATTTTYTCDRCGKTQNNRVQFWQVCVHVTTDAYPTVTHSSDWKHQQEWCRACVEEFDLLPRIELKDVPKPEPAPTFEDLLREIVREEVEATRG